MARRNICVRCWHTHRLGCGGRRAAAAAEEAERIRSIADLASLAVVQQTDVDSLVEMSWEQLDEILEPPRATLIQEVV